MGSGKTPGWKVRLVELAAELDDLGFDSVVRLPPGERPSLEIFVPPDRPAARSSRGGNAKAGGRTRRRPDWGRLVSERLVKGVR
ncbi:hypothetical protein Sme01_08320 [Sphaerisporangium melleum]|uniref:Uncharacterized protein n=1 Tax=Sphaerisporangium melleum TaxID=321316 RepID=A0A917VFY3_9ACTN|nr:hypothetical protein GCM10007964_13870 [Sphaerisporangium melleum]GII68356.1 hypothetical protein Sme01_08320 [Sphaerisporangium melleum]